MKFRRSAPSLLIGAVVIVVAGMACLSIRVFAGMTEKIEESQFGLMRSILEFNLKSAEGRALARAEMIANLPRIRELFAARDRPGLLAETAEMFRVQKEKYGVDQAQFHLPPAESFLRLNNPEQFGDDLSKFRPMVVSVNQDHLVRKGLAIARSGPAIFGVVPVLDPAGQPTGSFEFGIDFGPILDGLKEAYGLELTVFIEEEPLREFAKGVSGEVLGEQNRVGKYLKFHSTNWELMRPLATAKDLEGIDEPRQYARDSLGQPYGVLLVPLRNAAGAALGVMAVAKDFGGSRSDAGQARVLIGTLAVFAVVLLSGVILVVLRGGLLRPLAVLGERFEALAGGDASQAIEPTSLPGVEMRALARQYERLRTHGIPAADPASDEEGGA